MSGTPPPIVFHLLDLQARDIQIESETEDTREITYAFDGADDLDDADEDDEVKTQQRRRQSRHAAAAAAASNREFVIHLFGSLESGESIRCDVSGFCPSFYLRLPTQRTAEAVDAIRTYLVQQRVPIDCLRFQRVMRKTFYGFTAGTEYPFLRIEMPSLSLFRNVRTLFLDSQQQFATRTPLGGPFRTHPVVEVFEANLDPMLRFLHTQNIQPCNWITLRGSNLHTDIEDGVVQAHFSDVVPAPPPRASAPFLVASWDIECFSMTGDFPLAKRTWQKAAKDLVAGGWTGADALEFVCRSLSDTEDPPADLPPGMTPVYITWKHARAEEGRAAVDKIRSTPRILDKWLNVFKGKDVDHESVEALLAQTFAGVLSLRGDPCIQIGTTLTRGTADTLERHLFVYPSCAPIADVVVHAYPTEDTMILAWFEWIAERNADLLIGYNVFGFDEAYVWHRAEELGIAHHPALQAMNRLADVSGELKLEEKFLSSSAMGDNRMYIWSVQGRLQIDMFHYIKRNYNLPSYKLDEVTKYFMSGDLLRWSAEDTSSEAKQMRLVVAGAVKDVTVGRAITLLDETGETISPKLIVVAVDAAEGALVVDLARITEEEREAMFAELGGDQAAVESKGFKWVVVKDDVGPQDIFRLHREGPEGRAVVGKYCSMDCDLVLDLYKKLKTFNNSMSMANVCSVPIPYIFLRGQGIKIESLIFKFCQEKGVVIPVLPAPNQGGIDESYEGAIVLDPEPGFYSTSPIGVCDFASLYPSTIVSENISHDSLVWVKDFTDDGYLIRHRWGADTFDHHPGFAYTDIEYDIIRPDPADTRKVPRKIRCGRRICRFAQPLDGTKSTLPQITTWLLQARSRKKKEMGKENDPELKALLDAEQLAYKLTGNSLYGQLGSGTFKIRLQELAASVTAYGRKQILFAKAAIEKFYGPDALDPRCAARCMAKVVYGDSVAADTPVEIRTPYAVHRIPISELANMESGGEWLVDPVTGKESYELRVCESWTDQGWKRIHRIIRHRLPAGKRMFRVGILCGGDDRGYIDVTDDHSLLDPDGAVIKPTALKVGSRLLSTRYPLQGDEVTSIEELPNTANTADTIVYDLTTENHHFQAGPPGLIVHNTDSLFVEFNVKNPETGERLQGREAMIETMRITDEAGHFISKVLAPPHDFEFDKAFDPLLMFSKKRYAGNMYEDTKNPDDYCHKYMGIALKRRDNAPIVKTIYGAAMRMLLDKRDVVGAFQLVQEKCMELVEGKVSMSQLTVTKSLRAEYADPSRIAHKALADRMTVREPGNAPAAGDRIGYVYIMPPPGQQAAALQGDRIETPAFIKAHGLVPDYLHYIEHQLKNPISQAFGLLLEQIPGFHPSMMQKCPSMKEDIDRYLVYREEQAATLLFQPCIQRIHRESTRSVANRLGITVTPRLTKASSSASATQQQQQQGKEEARRGAPPKMVQTTMSRFMADSMFLDRMKTEKKVAAKAKAAAATAATSS